MLGALVVLGVVAVVQVAALVAVLVAALHFGARLAPFAVPLLRSISKMRDIHLRDVELETDRALVESERRIAATASPNRTEVYTDEEIALAVKRVDELRTETYRIVQMKDQAEKLRAAGELRKSIADAEHEIRVHRWAVQRGKVAA